MLTYLVAFAFSLCVSLAATPVIRKQARARGWLEQAAGSSRKIHREPTPRIGGIAILLGFYAPLLALFVVDSDVGGVFKESWPTACGLLGGGFAIALLGLYDDLRGADAVKKFTVQIAVAAVLYAAGFRIETLTIPLSGHVISLGVIGPALTLFWVVGVVNAMNLIDGLDGLAGGVAVFATIANFLLAFANDNILMCLIMAALAGAVIGFLAFNFNPASIFMGDTGSMFLGFVLATSSLKTGQKSGTAITLLVPMLALGVPIMDTLLTMGRRMLSGRPLFSADKDHIHHRVMSHLALSHRNAVLVLYAFCCLFASLSLAVAYATRTQSALMLGVSALIVLAFVRKLGYLRIGDASQLRLVRQRNATLRAKLREVRSALKVVHSVDEVWECIAPLGTSLHMSSFSLTVLGCESPHYEVKPVVVGAAVTRIELRMNLIANQSVLGHLGGAWQDGRTVVNRDDELVLEDLAEVVAKAVMRIQATTSKIQSASARILDSQ